VNGWRGRWRAMNEHGHVTVVRCTDRQEDATDVRATKLQATYTRYSTDIGEARTLPEKKGWLRIINRI
jgi:hypothetical protein